jgi:hypothetical protein
MFTLHSSFGPNRKTCDRVLQIALRSQQAAVAVERAVARPLPARIPACDITAPGSSGILASASRAAIAFSEVGTDNPAHPVRSVFLV